MTDVHRLPAHFKSLYRLFLRLASAAVLDQPRASRNLRRRWRPSFDDAARVTREIQQDATKLAGGVEWLKLWHARMDNTLEFLYTSSHSRGIPDAVTRALSHSFHQERAREVSKVILRRTWKPQQPEYASQHLKADNKKKAQELMEDNALGALNDLQRMAEAHSNLILGTNTVPLGRYVYRPRRK